MKEIFFFDVDGTLLDSSFYMQPSTYKALKQLKQLGHLLCIATGRSYDSLKRTQLLDKIEFDAIICNNGQSIYIGESLFYEKFFTPKQVTEFLKIASTHHLPVVIKCKQRFLSQEADKNTIDVHQHFNNPLPPVGHYSHQKVESMNIYAPLDFDYSCFDSIEGLHIIPCHLAYAEVTQIGLSKASGIKKLLDYYHQDHYIAFGDSPNDLEMLQEAHTAIVMGQAIDKVKALATFITYPIFQDGIWHALIKLNYIKETTHHD